MGAVSMTIVEAAQVGRCSSVGRMHRRELRSLGRPVAIVFPAGGSAYERWLRSNVVGDEVYADDAVRVWRLDV